MVQIFSSFNGIEIVFLICAIIGGVLVFTKLVMQHVGGDVDVDGHLDSDVGFHILSIHGLASFAMMFGLVGLALYRQSQVGIVISLAGAVLAGLFSVWLIGKLFKAINRLQSSGTLSNADAVGSTGVVYLTIPEGGTGLVSLSFHNRLRELNAVAKDGGRLETGTPVRVVQVNANILVVEKTQ